MKRCSALVAKIGWLIAPAACFFVVGCNDVGDDNVAPIPDSATSDSTTPSGSGSGSSSGSDSGSNGSGNDGAATEAGPGESDAGTDADATMMMNEPDGTAPDASAPDAADAESPDTGVADTGAAEASLPDAEADGSGPDAAPEAGGPVLCTSAPCPADSIKCDGTTSGVCTLEEQIIARKDIANGFITGTQLNTSGNNRSCYECLVSAGCIDTSRNHGSECGDLNGTISGGASAGETLANACLDVINCIEGSTFSPGNQFPGTTTGTCANDNSNGVLNCFCGPALDDSSTCNSAPATMDNGACRAVEYAGFGATSSTANSVIIGEYTDTTTAAGMANNLFQCAGANSGAPSCPQCF